MKKKVSFLADEWKVKIGKDLPGIEKKYNSFEWMLELLLKEKKECQKSQQK